MKKPLNRHALQHHANKLSEIGLQTYGRAPSDMMQTTADEKLRLAEKFIREYHKDFLQLLGCTAYEQVSGL